MRLYIAEKPSMARELAACLKNPQKCNGFIKTSGGIVTWLVGHVLEQAEPDAYDPKYKIWRAEDLPIVPKRWKLEVNPSTNQQFQIVKNLIAKADEIIHAGDPDREGQLLVDEVLDFVGNKKPVKRILLNALDETSILRANKNLRDNAEFFNLKQSALARSRADWLIGMNLSRAYTLAARRRGYRDLVLPIGRVKTPTLGLVVRREREIKNFKPVNFYNIRATFAHLNGNFLAQFKPSKKMLDLQAFDSEGRLIDKKFAEELIKKFSNAPLDGKISSFKTIERKEGQPLPFSLSTLQVTAGKAFGYTPQQVLEAAQSLYEKKLTSYPRSDCEFLPTTQFRDAQKILKHLSATNNESLKNLVTHANSTVKSRAWNDKKISAHHAIIPTQKPLNMQLPAVELNIYNLIAKNYAVQFYPPHIYDETVVEVKYKGEMFTSRGKVVKQLGWREFYVAPKVKADDETEMILPRMKTGDDVTHKKSELKQGTTTPPKPFTSSSLVQGMKDIHKYVKNPDAKKQLKDVYGIGTEATRAAIIEDLIQRGFLQVVKKSLQPTEKAYLLIDALPDEMTYPDATAIWEDKLHSMSAGDGTLEDFLAGQVNFTSKLCAAATKAKFAEAESVFKCPNCGSALVKRISQGRNFWGCANYPECKTAFDDADGKPDFDGKIRAARLIKEGAPKCPTCGAALVKRKGKNGEFWGCSSYPKCRTTFDDKGGKPDFDGKKFLRAKNFNSADFEPIISSADFR
ncbi:MAG: DNA topoisomerase III [Selenomonadaceae bacterium]|nr:DNA topoisomerase III [Selenomonadaceae bacterium]